ncbi:MAG: class I SAM-dependent methyltransferase [Abitibacteriaceae bacterium]|nr:class I SAM-dependent methyltransferase [Abditibacteriaceae bacterium]
MAESIQLYATCCAICGTYDNATELYPANFDFAAFNPAIFSARRLPDRIHYRLVRCNTCGLVRSDPVADAETLTHLYVQSSFDYGAEVASLRRTYGHYLAKLRHYGGRSERLLEIGCGNGFLLEEALRRGYKQVYGVEPSTEAVAKANARVRPHIICDIMRPELFDANYFDAVCLFQVFDHIPDPGALLDECFKVLKPGGLMLCLNHNVQAVSARLLGERSPIIDLEHTYLYSPSTMSHIVEAHGFKVRQVGPVFNNYPLHYLTRLLPLPNNIKLPLLDWLGRVPLGRRMRLSVPLGNLYLIAQKTEVPG